jgi:fatty acid desaturase
MHLHRLRPPVSLLAGIRAIRAVVVKFDPLRYVPLQWVCFALAAVGLVTLLVQVFFPNAYLPLMRQWPYVLGIVPLILLTVFYFLIGFSAWRFAKSQSSPMPPSPDRHNEGLLN